MGDHPCTCTLAHRCGVEYTPLTPTHPPSHQHARNTSGLLEHHDAMPGTSFRHCTQSFVIQCDCYDDYNNRLWAARNLTDTAITQLTGAVLSKR